MTLKQFKTLKLGDTVNCRCDDWEQGVSVQHWQCQLTD